MSDAEELERVVTERTAGIRYSRLAVWKDVLFHPTETLEREAEAASLKQGAKDLFVSFFVYMLVVLLIYVLIYGFVISLIFGIAAATTGRLDICGWPLLLAALGIVAAFVGAALLSAFGRC